MFTLHPQLAADSFILGDFPLCRLLLMNDANFPWFILVPRRAAVREIYELPDHDQQQLLRESSHLAARLTGIFRADKLNIAALGNLVPQLHIHVVGRNPGDPCWPGVVWGNLPPGPGWAPEQLRDISSAIAQLRPFRPA